MGYIENKKYEATGFKLFKWMTKNDPVYKNCDRQHNISKSFCVQIPTTRTTVDEG